MRYVLSLVLTVISATAVPQNVDTAKTPKSAQVWDPKSIKWQDTDADGTKYALLGGRRDVPGEAFTYAFCIPAGYHEHHWHSAEARVAVIQGALNVSFGETLDLKHTDRLSRWQLLARPGQREAYDFRRCGHDHHRNCRRSVGDAPPRRTPASIRKK
jgi:hypothetical protein